jgi:hypothetical protein
MPGDRRIDHLLDEPTQATGQLAALLGRRDGLGHGDLPLGLRGLRRGRIAGILHSAASAGIISRA